MLGSSTKPVHLMFDLPYVVHRAGHSAAGLSVYNPYEGREVYTGAAKLGLSSILAAYVSLSHIKEGLSIDRVLLTDEHTRSFRHGLHEGYKSTRAKARLKQTPQQKLLRSDYALCKAVISFVMCSLGCQLYWKDGLEADDVMGCLCRELWGDDIYIFSSDSDMLQLCLLNNIKLMVRRDNNNEYYGVGNLHEYVRQDNRHWDVQNGLEVLLYKAMVGDSSDDYGGVPGVGIAGFNRFMGKLRASLDGHNLQAAVVAVLRDPLSISSLGVDDKVVSKVVEGAESFRSSLKLAKLVCRERVQGGLPSVRLNDASGTLIKPTGDFSLVLELLRGYGMLQAAEQVESFRALHLPHRR